MLVPPGRRCDATPRPGSEAWLRDAGCQVARRRGHEELVGRRHVDPEARIRGQLLRHEPTGSGERPGHRGGIADRHDLQRILETVSYTHLRAHETRHDLVCRLLL